MDRATGHARKIKILVKQNPHGAKSAAFKFFAALEKSPTVGEYLGKFKKDEKKLQSARLWMNTHRRNGVIKLTA